jgi:hypothetical protein
MAPAVLLPVLLAAHAEARCPFSSPPGRRLTLSDSQPLVTLPAATGDLAG